MAGSQQLEAAFAASLLPGDGIAAGSAQLAQAAQFVAHAAAQREGRAPVIMVESISTTAARHLRIAIINDDMPFLVDSVASAIAAEGLEIDLLLHPVVATRRDSSGKLTDILAGDAPGKRHESMIYVETERAPLKVRTRLEASLAAVLADVQAAVADWPAMQAALLADAEALADAEGAALLRWFHAGALTQLGHVVRHKDGTQRNALGICRASTPDLLTAASFKRAFAWFEGGGTAPLAIKANITSNVHRRVPLDLFILPVREGGRLTALSVHAGLWTSAALGTPPDRVPRLRSQLSSLESTLGFNPSGHAGKALVHAFTSLPHDLMIGFAADDAQRVALAMMSLVDRPRAQMTLVRSALERHLFAFVWLPREDMSAQLRLEIQAMLARAADAQLLDWSLTIEGSNLALLRFVFDIRDGDAIPDEAALNTDLQRLVRGWSDAVEAELAQSLDATRAAALAARFADHFPPGYRGARGPAEAAEDIRRLLGIARGGSGDVRRDVRLVACGDGAGQMRLKLYQNSGVLALSDAVPVLENFGFRVLEETPTALDDGKLGTIHDFRLEASAGTDCAALLTRADGLEPAIAAVLNGKGEDDAFNRLMTAAGLEARHVVWLRSWFRYLRQAGMAYGIPTVVEALRGAPAVTRGLIDLFIARHDPAFAGDRAKAESSASTAIHDGLAAVNAINDDRLLRQHRALVDAILRTNAFAPAGEAELAYKIESALIPGLPKPVPWREIFVYSPRVEGIHLRAGPVARGGLRWSDRRDDFRTEVLGLMKAQRVKNAVIVPTGAKGGFYPKQLPNPAVDRDGWLAEGKESYKLFIRTLLSITDNIVKGKVVHPRAVVVRDGEDPYFVVAADKGTATYSDTANAIADEAGFWLDDAFASGGSNGYDHKAMAITAKGAWLSVQRHFLEMGVDVQADPVTVVGVGDMSGDVFGNGMLLSKSIRLMAAFDHRHIFLDPDPDPAISWAERARLFALPRSSWEDYDKALISAGGGVFPRGQKSIPLSPQVRAILGLSGAETDPETLMTAILKADVGLLWFGGIGTYIKGAGENNIQVGDPANDTIRINGADVRARVIGEGANLGTTQAGRIDYALSGGRLNTDFIDNSAGVDCSDNEVNIKIALAAAKRAGRLDEANRVSLLASMTDDVAHLVLEDNRLQALGLSIAQGTSTAAMPSYIRLIEHLEEAGKLDRRTEGLADNETLKRRGLDGAGLTRPELAVLLSSVKIALKEAIEASTLADDEGLDADLLAAFPAAMQGPYRADILGHQLRRQIIATKIANRLINRLGMLHPYELVEEEGTSLAHVASAFVAAERLLGMGGVWHDLETKPMSESARLMLFDKAASAMRSQMADLIRISVQGDAPSALVEQLTSGVSLLAGGTAQLLNPEGQLQSARMVKELVDAGAPADSAKAIAHLFDIDGAIGLAHLAAQTGRAADVLTRAFSDLGAALGLDWAQLAATRMAPSDPWERLLAAGLARDFQAMRLAFLARAGEVDPVQFVADWAGANISRIRQFRALVARAQAAAPAEVAMLAQIASQARNLLGR